MDKPQPWISPHAELPVYNFTHGLDTHSEPYRDVRRKLEDLFQRVQADSPSGVMQVVSLCLNGTQEPLTSHSPDDFFTFMTALGLEYSDLEAAINAHE